MTERLCLACGEVTNDPCVNKTNDTYNIATSSGDRTFLWWLVQRLVNVYKEDPNTDFVQTLRKFASYRRPPKGVHFHEVTDCDWDELHEAFRDAVDNGEGTLGPKALRHELQKRGITLLKERS